MSEQNGPNPPIEQALAQRIISRMGETGQPPERGALHVNVGTGQLLEALRREYLELIRQSGFNSTFKLVQGPFGAGKSHFLACFRELAWQAGFATSLVGVSPKECPFFEMSKVYREVAQRLELPPENELTEPDRGIDTVLRQILEKRQQEVDTDELRDWLRSESRSARVESHAWRKAAFSYMECLLLRRYDQADLLAQWLRGERVALSEVAPLGVREELEESTAFRWLRSMVQFLRAVDVPGVVLMFDELDRVMSIGRRHRKAVGDNLRQLIDACGQSTLPAVVMLYAVPPEFMEHIAAEYPALQQRLRSTPKFSPNVPTAPIIDLDLLPLDPLELFRQIGDRLIGIYSVAYPQAGLDRKLQRKNVAALARLMASEQLETGQRRQFVRAVVALLAEQHRSGQRELDEGDLRTFAGAAQVESELQSLEGEEEF